jgi:hypothetical protein
MSFGTSHISSTSAETVHIKYTALDQIRAQNDKIKDWPKKYNATIEVIDTMAVAERMGAEITGHVSKLYALLASNKSMMLCLIANKRPHIRLLKHLEELEASLSEIMEDALPQTTHTLQCILVEELNEFYGKGISTVDEHISALQESYTGTKEEPRINYCYSCKLQAKPIQIFKETEVEVHKEPEPEREVIELSDDEDMFDDRDDNPQMIPEALFTRSPSISPEPKTTNHPDDMIEEADKLYQRIKNMEGPARVIRFRPPPGYKTVREDSEKITGYWNSVIGVLIDKYANFSGERFGMTYPMIKAGPDHRPLFIGQHHNGGYIAGNKKNTVLPYMTGELAIA